MIILLLSTLLLFTVSTQASFLDDIQAPYLNDKFKRREFQLSLERQTKAFLCPQGSSEKIASVISLHQIPPPVHLHFNQAANKNEPPTYMVGTYALRDVDSPNIYYFLAVKNEKEATLQLMSASVNYSQVIIKPLKIELPLKQKEGKPPVIDAQDLNLAVNAFDSFIKSELSSGTGNLIASRQISLCN